MSALLGIGAEARADAATTAAERTRELYESHGQRVFTFCQSRLGNREEAQDATQTTFIYAMRSLERGVVLEFELAWLLKIAFNVCRSTRRSSHWQMATASQGLVEVDDLPDVSPSDGLERNARLEALREGLRSLPENQQRAILLREWQGLSYAEIADELGLTVSAVETLLFRARRSLTTRLEPVRGAFTALDLSAAWPLLRSLSRGLGAKLMLAAAAASIALVPVAGERVLQARAGGKRAPAIEKGLLVEAGRASTKPTGGRLRSVPHQSASRTDRHRVLPNPHAGLRPESLLTGPVGRWPQPGPPGVASSGSSTDPKPRSAGDPLPSSALPTSIDPPAAALPQPEPQLLSPTSVLSRLPSADETLAPLAGVVP
jgi:RNA polymerase sigma-70 factor (ECF subfamily)